MGVLHQDVPTENALRLGYFAIDTTAQAVADGDRFFQRHAAILGSTGSGKSYTVASLLERANTLSHPNIVLLDMQGSTRLSRRVSQTAMQITLELLDRATSPIRSLKVFSSHTGY